MTIKFTYEGFDKIYNTFDNLEDKLNNELINDILNQVGVKLSGNIRNNFYNQVDPYNYRWAPFKHGGRVSKKGIDTSAKLLLDTGMLVNSINYNVKNNVLEIGTPVFYAQYHQEGDGVPKRSFLPDQGLPDSWNKDIINIIEKVLNNLV